MIGKVALEPFPDPGGPPLPYTVECVFLRRGEFLLLDYTLAGDLNALALAAPEAEPARRDGLWEHTCFEFFLAPHGSNLYWEGNLAPSGHWNLYQFLGYRQGRKEEPALSALAVRSEGEEGIFRLGSELKLDRLLAGHHSWRLGLSAVIADRDGRRAYWALTHRETRPDFHRWDSFLVNL